MAVVSPQMEPFILSGMRFNEVQIEVDVGSFGGQMTFLLLDLPFLCVDVVIFPKTTRFNAHVGV